MDRRAFLFGAAATVTAAGPGCLSRSNGSRRAGMALGTPPPASLTVDATNDAELAAHVLYSVGGGDPPGEAARVLEGAIGDATTVTGTEPPLRSDELALFDGGVYHVSSETVDETPAVRYSVRIDVPQRTASDRETVRFSDLPAVDRRIFAARGFDEDVTVGIGTTLVYPASERERSALVPESEYEYIVWRDGSRAKWAVDDSRDATLFTYRYTAEQRTTAAEYGRQLRERYAIALSDLSDAQREIVEAAVDGDPYVVEADRTTTAGFDALADTIRSHDRLRRLEQEDGDPEGPYVLRYDGDLYAASLFVDE